MENNEGESSSQLSHNKLRDVPECIQAVIKTGGNVSKASELLGVNRRTLTNYIRDNQELQLALSEARDTRTDEVEQAFRDQCIGNKELGIKPNVIAQIFYLKCQAKDKGFREGEIPEQSAPVDDSAADKKQASIKSLLDDYFKDMPKASKPKRKQPKPNTPPNG